MTRAMMAMFDEGHRLELPGGYWMRKDNDDCWQVGRGEAYCAFHIETNVSVGKGGSFDNEVKAFAEAMMTERSK